MADVKVKINGDDSDLKKKLNSASASIAKWSAAAVAAAGAAAIALTKAGLDSADALAKQSRALNTSAKDLLTLQRAASLSGISSEQLTTALRTMTVNLGQASSGTGATYEAIQRLGLSLSELNTMSAAEKMDTLTARIKEVIPASQQAAVAADLFGSRSALAMANLDSGTIKHAADMIKKFGVELSAVEYKQIEQANDAVTDMKLAYQSVTQQLAAAFAPTMQMVANIIGDVASDNLELKQTFKDFALSGVQAASLIAQAFYGLKGAFLAAGTGIDVIQEKFYEAQRDKASNMLKMLQQDDMGWFDKATLKVEGYNVGSEEERAASIKEAAAKVKEYSDKLLGNTKEIEQNREELQKYAQQIEDLQNGKFEKMWVESERKSYEEAAKAAVEARNQIQPPTEQAEQENPELVKMREETQKMLEELQSRYKDEDILLTEKYAKDLETLLAVQEQKLISEQEFDALMLETNQKYEDDLTKITEDAAKAREDIAKAEMQAKLNTAKKTLGQISSLMESDSRKTFEIGKAAALASATITGLEAIVTAYQKGLEAAPGPAAPAVGAAYAAVAAIATGMQIQKISSMQYGGGGGSGGGGTMAAPATPSVAQTQQPERQVANISLQGSMFSRDSVIGLMEEMNSLLADGVRLNVT